MNKFALIGKGISHSRSPEMYRKLISPNITYNLLDYENEFAIPSAAKLLSLYDGVNITSPYKKHFLYEVELTKNAREIGAINCLKKDGNHIVGENTDYLAIVDIIKKMTLDYGELEIIILGDGVMSSVTQVALKNLSLKYKVLSRKLTKDFCQLNMDTFLQNKKARPLIINTCARDFIFQGNIPKESLFWDYNYSFEQHSLIIPNKVHAYMDGLEMLERQAFYAVAFWSNKHSR